MSKTVMTEGKFKVTGKRFQLVRMKFTCSSGYKNIDGDFLYIGQRILESLMST